MKNRRLQKQLPLGAVLIVALTMNASCRSRAALDEAFGTALESSAPALRPSSAGESPASAEALVEPYPIARWRLAPADDLARVMLWVSHVLIRHAEVRADVVCFDLGDWTVAGPAPARSRGEAFELARSLASELQSAPERFAEVARRVSEDVATRERGGSLGGITAADLYLQYENVLDTLAALTPGEVSRVVETSCGFHVFFRRAPPAEEAVSGTRIVIAHDDAPWLGAFLARRPLAPRSRSDALALAQALYERARRGADFESLVDEYSDHQEAALRGDFGQWSTHERSPFPREVELMAELEVDEVAPPLDTPFGIQIIKRVPNRPREIYAMTTVQQRFEFARPDADPSSRKSVSRNLAQLAAQVRGSAAAFDALQKQYCCTEIQQWEEGRGAAFAEQALKQLSIGQVAMEPIDLGPAYALVKRVAPGPVTKPEPLLEMPAPARPDLEHLVEKAVVNHQLGAAARRAVKELGLSKELAERLTALHDERVASDEAELEQDRVRAFTQFSSDVQALLGNELYTRYLDVLHDHFEDQLLKQPPRYERRKMSALHAQP